MAKRKKTEHLVIAGPAPYIEHMAKHLKKEHPSTKHRLKVLR